MAVLTIPLTPGIPFFSQDVVLEGTTYRLTFKYNQREDVFYMDVGLSSETDDLASSLKIIVNRGLLRRWSGAFDTWPPGEIVAITTNGDDSPPGLNDLGSRIVLTYTTSDDPQFVS